jgi:hypothetical protein
VTPGTSACSWRALPSARRQDHEIDDGQHTVQCCRSSRVPIQLVAELSRVVHVEAEEPDVARNAVSARRAGRLWGVSLCGPMLIADPSTGTRATSQPEPAGPTPAFSGFADGPVTWGGERWFAFPLSMLPANAAGERRRRPPTGNASRAVPSHSAAAGAHHGRRLQRARRVRFPERRRANGARRFAKGLPPTLASRPGPIPRRTHLDTLEGRVSIQLEWRALRRAIESTGSDRAEEIADALAFRRDCARAARFAVRRHAGRWLTIGSVVALVAAVALLAVSWPAWRAASVDPTTALRAE